MVIFSVCCHCKGRPHVSLFFGLLFLQKTKMVSFGGDVPSNEVRSCQELSKETTFSSPTSVLAAQDVGEGKMIEPITLGHGRCDVDKWVCPASAKSKRTINPIRAIVDPIAKQIQTGKQRDDGKDLISLAVSMTKTLQLLATLLNLSPNLILRLLLSARRSNRWWQSSTMSSGHPGNC